MAMGAAQELAISGMMQGGMVPFPASPVEDVSTAQPDHFVTMIEAVRADCAFGVRAVIDSHITVCRHMVDGYRWRRNCWWFGIVIVVCPLVPKRHLAGKLAIGHGR